MAESDVLDIVYLDRYRKDENEYDVQWDIVNYSHLFGKNIKNI